MSVSPVTHLRAGLQMKCCVRFLTLVFVMRCATLCAQHEHGSAESVPAQTNTMDRAMSAEHEHGEHHMEMPGFYGGYSMTREASGTAWQPEASPMEGLHVMRDDWMLMFHGFAFGVYDYQSGDRGDRKFFSPNMLMGMAQHPLGMGTFGLRTMLSLEPATIGRTGYPELLQTGETADGTTPLIDRQHPHDLFMELAAAYSLPFGNDSSGFAYFGYPGEPALGPATFMHRFSGMDIPEAPITHHWLDSTHITFGVTTRLETIQDRRLDLHRTRAG